MPTASTTNGGATIHDVATASASDTDDTTDPDPIPVNFTIPAGTPAGTYTLVGTLTDGGGITDTDTSDKTFSSTPITIGGGLQVNIDGTRVFPTKTVRYVNKVPTGLNVGQFWGTEEITVGITLTNNGSTPITNGEAALNLFASGGLPSGPTLNGASPILLKHIELKVDETSAAGEYDERMTVPRGIALMSGGKYFIVAQITPKLPAPATNTPSDDATAQQFEYMGAPAQGTIPATKTQPATPYDLTPYINNQYITLLEKTVTDGTYYIRQKAGGKAIDPTDLAAWIKVCEGPGLTPYLDTAGHATIGYGLDLTAIDQVPGLEIDIMFDVQNYYAQRYKINLDSLSDDQIISMLSAQAPKNGFATVNGRPIAKRQAINIASTQALLTEAVPIYRQDALEDVPSLTTAFGAPAVVALEDFTFNSGSISAYQSIANALNQNTPDLALAGFQLFNKLRTIHGGRGQLTRTEAEYQNLMGADAMAAKSVLLLP